MDHTHAEELDPAGVATHLATLLLAKRTAQRQFKTRLRKWKIKWLAFDVDGLLVVLAQERFEGCHQVARMNAFAYIHTFELVKSVLMTSVQILITEHAARQDYGDRLALL